MAETRTAEPAVLVQLVDGAIDDAVHASIEHAGAMLSFRGVVRPLEAGRLLEGLSYTSYEPMAQRQLSSIADQVVKQYEVLQVRLAHSRGFVAAGDTSLWVTIASKHRKPGLQAMDCLLDGLKRDVPIWKKPVYAQGEDR